MYELTKKNLKIHNAKHKEQSVSEKINLWYNGLSKKIEIERGGNMKVTIEHGSNQIQNYGNTRTSCGLL